MQLGHRWAGGELCVLPQPPGHCKGQRLLLLKSMGSALGLQMPTGQLWWGRAWHLCLQFVAASFLTLNFGPDSYQLCTQASYSLKDLSANQLTSPKFT